VISQARLADKDRPVVKGDLLPVAVGLSVHGAAENPQAWWSRVKPSPDLTLTVGRLAPGGVFLKSTAPWTWTSPATKTKKVRALEPQLQHGRRPGASPSVAERSALHPLHRTRGCGGGGLGAGTCCGIERRRVSLAARSWRRQRRRTSGSPRGRVIVKACVPADVQVGQSQGLNEPSTARCTPEAACPAGRAVETARSFPYPATTVITMITKDGRASLI
jgi:hypothetical protein